MQNEGTIAVSRKQRMGRDLIVFTVTIALVLLFTYTAFSKLLEQDKFIFQMRQAPLPMMKGLAPVLAWLLPIAEICIVTSLVKTTWRLIGLYASLILLTLFEGYIILLLSSGHELPCSCGGVISQMGWVQHIFFNGFFILLTILAIYNFKNHKK